MGALLAKGLDIATAIKSLLPKKTKPNILDAENCSVKVSEDAETVWFELLVSNVGSKGCVIVDIGLEWPSGAYAELGYEGFTPLPFNISPDQTERVIMYGFSHKGYGFGPACRLKIGLKDKTVAGKVTVRFNTNYIIKKRIIFDIIRK